MLLATPGSRERLPELILAKHRRLARMSDLPSQRRPDRPPETRYDVFLGVARDLDRMPTAYDAELVVSTMLGAAYGIADAPRAAIIRDTADGLRRHLAPRRTRTATLLRSVLAALAVTRGRTPNPPPEPPAWLAHVGVVRLTGTHAFGDRGADQITYLASFAYADEEVGGPEHVVAAIVDRRLGHVTDLFVVAPAGALLAQLEAAAATDAGVRLVGVDPGELRDAVEHHLAVTDDLPDLPAARSLTSDRAIAAHRLRLLPELVKPAPPTVADFHTAPEAVRLGGADPESLAFALKLIGEYSHGDLRYWTPAAVEDFLLTWLPARALLDRADAALLPTALSAWVRWSGRVGGQSPREVAQNVAAVVRHRGEFARRVHSGSHRSEAVRAMAELLADGVDVDDERAVAEWLDRYNKRSG
jgi:hypothetical protein